MINHKEKLKLALKVDTKVYVKESKSADWKLRHFMAWGYNGDILCYKGNSSSANYTPGLWNGWKYWKVATGNFIARTNIGE